MRIKTTILAIVIVGFFAGCSATKVNRGVNADNVYYSEKLPSVKISIDKRFTYSPTHTAAKKHKGELFLDSKTNESVFIRIYKGDYEPNNSFSDKNMVSVEEKNILGLKYYVGTAIFKDHDGYYLKRIHLHYPNLYTMLIIMHTRPLRMYGDHYDWSKISKLTEKQKELIDDFVMENSHYVRFVE